MESRLQEWRRERRVQRMLRQMDRIGRRSPRMGRSRPARPSFGPRARAAVSVLIVLILLGGFSVRLMHDTGGASAEWTSVESSSPGELVHPPGGGAFRYMATQDDSDEPVTYDPCEIIRVVVNPRTAPPDGDAIVSASLAAVEEATGLTFRVVGSTDEPPRTTSASEGDDWPPIQISWTDSAEVPELDGTAIGLGGSSMVERDGHRWYVTGGVMLDGPRLAEYGPEVTTAILMHELGHVVGLHHVPDENELMHLETSVSRWGPGDLVGLEALGQGVCR